MSIPPDFRLGFVGRSASLGNASGAGVGLCVSPRASREVLTGPSAGGAASPRRTSGETESDRRVATFFGAGSVLFDSRDREVVGTSTSAIVLIFDALIGSENPASEDGIT